MTLMPGVAFITKARSVGPILIPHRVFGWTWNASNVRGSNSSATRGRGWYSSSPRFATVRATCANTSFGRWSRCSCCCCIEIIFRSARRRARQGAEAGLPDVMRPGLDSEFYRLELELASRGLVRHASEPLSTWLQRAACEPGFAQGQRAPSSKILRLHYRYRFLDPHGLKREMNGSYCAGKWRRVWHKWKNNKKHQASKLQHPEKLQEPTSKHRDVQFGA